MEGHSARNLIVSADWAEQRNEAQIGLALTEKCVCASAREGERGFSVLKEESRWGGTWPWMPETDVINQKPFYEIIFCFSAPPPSLYLSHTMTFCASPCLCDRPTKSALWLFEYAKYKQETKTVKRRVEGMHAVCNQVSLERLKLPPPLQHTRHTNYSVKLPLSENMCSWNFIKTWLKGGMCRKM